MFPPNSSSLGKNVCSECDWKRIPEIVNDPHFFSDGPTRFDVNQGRLNNCWVLVAMTNLLLHNTLFHKVVPIDQADGFNPLTYSGVFHFRFWHFGKWTEVRH